jgi:lipid-A-disaccharide synthase
VRCLRERIPNLAVEGLGGPELIDEGVKLHADLVSHAIIGFGPAIQAAPKLLGLLRRVAGALDKRRPDVVVLVDYPGFNLFVARLAKKRGIPVVYFVAPQLWAWAPWRVKRFARVVDEAHVIFPFEEAFFGAAGIETHWVGHPLIDGLPSEPPILPAIADLPRPVALLPGSRRR